MRVQIRENKIIGFNNIGSLHFINLPSKWFSDDLPPIVNLEYLKLIELILNKSDTASLLTRSNMIFDFKQLPLDIQILIDKNILDAINTIKKMDIKSVNNNIFLYCKKYNCKEV